MRTVNTQAYCWLLPARWCISENLPYRWRYGKCIQWLKKPHQSQQSLGVFTGTTATHHNKTKRHWDLPWQLLRLESGHQRVNWRVPTISLASQPHYSIPSGTSSFSHLLFLPYREWGKKAENYHHGRPRGQNASESFMLNGGIDCPLLRKLCYSILSK